MKPLSEYRDEEALDLVADLVEPVAELIKDREFSTAVDTNRAAAVRIAIKSHKPTVMQILARLEGVPIEAFHCDVFTLPARLFEVLSNPTLIAVFSQSAAMIAAVESSTSPSASTADAEK